MILSLMLLEAVEIVKFIFSKKATKIDKIFTVNLTFTTYRQINGEDFINFCGLLRKHELYKTLFEQKVNVFIPNRITLGTFQITLKFLKIAFILYFVY